MYKPHPDDIRARNIHFIVHGKLPPLPKLRDSDWAYEHGFPCANPDIIGKAREDFFNSWPKDGLPLDVEGLEAAFALAMQTKPELRRDCKRCGTSLSKDNRKRGLCGHCCGERATAFDNNATRLRHGLPQAAQTGRRND